VRGTVWLDRAERHRRMVASSLYAGIITDIMMCKILTGSSEIIDYYRE
jgi:hypothetical protein